MPLEDFIEPKRDGEERAPGWIVTFADLMALLMCFFVLLLSFSSMDVEKYKRIAASMREAFGTRTQANFDGSLDANGIVAPQSTGEAPQPEAVCAVRATSEADARRDAQRSAAEKAIVDEVAGLVGQTEHDAVTLAGALSKEIAAGVLEVETNGRKIILRVKEHGSFPSGSASLTSDFKPVLKIIRGVLKNTSGQIFVEGHTDDVPITTSQFRSNLELSSSRAISVAHGLFEDGALDQRRFTVTGYADSRPLTPNDTLEGRMRNRRVEVVIQQGLGDGVKKDLDTLRSTDPEGFDRVRVELMRRFNLKPDEIY
jgi:chemotaxis protein MotB